MEGVARLPDGSVKRLITINRWDFRWQDQYRYQTPVFLPKGTTLSMHFTYDNSDRNPRNPQRPPQRVKWGPQSTNEMGALWLEVLPRRQEDVAMLMRDYAERSLRADIAGAEMQVDASPGDALAHNFLATKYLQAGRVEDATAQLELAIRLKPDDAEAHSNLASALQVQGRLPEAVQHAREAVRLKPDDDRVRFNLGNAMSATGNIDAGDPRIRPGGRSSIRRTRMPTSIWRCCWVRETGSMKRSRICGGRWRSTRGMPTPTGIWPSPSGSRGGSTRRSAKPARR